MLAEDIVPDVEERRVLCPGPADGLYGLACQGLVGSAQYAMELPPGMVWIHVVLAALRVGAELDLVDGEELDLAGQQMLQGGGHRPLLFLGLSEQNGAGVAIFDVLRDLYGLFRTRLAVQESLYGPYV